MPRRNSPPPLTLLPDSTLVESQLITLQDVAIHPTALARSRRHDGVQSTSLELSLESRVDLATGSVTGSLLLGHAAALLLFGRRSSLLLPSPAQVLAVVCLVPLSERSGVDLNDSGFGKGVCPDKFVVRGVVGHDDHTDFAGDSLRTPGEVAGFEAQATEFLVSTAGTDDVNSLRANTGIGWLAALIERSIQIQNRVVRKRFVSPQEEADEVICTVVTKTKGSGVRLM